MTIENIPEFFEYILKTPIHYTWEGKDVETNKIKVHCPKGGQVLKSFRLEQILTRAMYQSQSLLKSMVKGPEKVEIPTKDEPSGFTGETVALFLRGSDIDIEEALDVFALLALDGCVTVFDIKMNALQWNELQVDQQLGLLYEFSAVFIAPSAFPQAKETEEGDLEKQLNN